jgi:SAM-dependent methyltransferase
MSAVAYGKLEQHNREIHENREAWTRKPVLRRAYDELYRAICGEIEHSIPGIKVELGSGMGNIRSHLPDCITTDLFSNPWLDRVENAYHLSFPDESVGHLILFDVWHHLEHPANALAEFRRVLVPCGRVILLEPAMSLVGRVVYGNCHHEPLGFNTPLSDQSADLTARDAIRYFAAQSSSHRIFLRRELPRLLDGWEIRAIRPITSFAYLGSGGFRGPQIYPETLYPVVKLIDHVLGLVPSLFAARLLVCISKKP